MRKRDKILRLLIAALLIMGAAICAAAQTEPPGKHNAREQTGATETVPTKVNALTDDARYFYEFKQPEFFISHIIIEHDAAGQGTVSFSRKGVDDLIVEPLVLSNATRARISGLWEALRFLDSDVDYQSDKQFPHLGTMFLRMTRGTQMRSVKFNWTHDANADALVKEYRRAADQAIFIFDINLARENQPLNAPKLMDQLETMLRLNGLSDPKQLIPLLREVYMDERIPLIARNHAERIIKKIEK